IVEGLLCALVLVLDARAFQVAQYGRRALRGIPAGPGKPARERLERHRIAPPGCGRRPAAPPIGEIHLDVLDGEITQHRGPVELAREVLAATQQVARVPNQRLVGQSGRLHSTDVALYTV